MTVQPMQFGMEAAEKAHEGSVLTHSESDWAGDADRFSVRGTVVSLRQTWLISRDCIQPEAIDTIAISSWEAEMFAAVSGACEGVGLKQQWNWSESLGNTWRSQTPRRLDVGSLSHEDPVAAQLATSCQLGLHIEPDGTRSGC